MKILTNQNPVFRIVANQNSVLTISTNQNSPSRGLLPQFCLDEPEADPGAHHDDDEWRVDLEDVEADGAVEGEGEEDDRPGKVPTNQNTV